MPEPLGDMGRKKQGKGIGRGGGVSHTYGRVPDAVTARAADEALPNFHGFAQVVDEEVAMARTARHAALAEGLCPDVTYGGAWGGGGNKEEEVENLGVWAPSTP